MEKPETIFKYFPADYYSLIGLLNGRIHFGSPKDFNDIYDCAQLPRLVVPSEAALISALQKDVTKLNQAQNEIKNLGFENWIDGIQKETLETLRKIQKKFTETMGVACFSQSNSNLRSGHIIAINTGAFVLNF